MQVWCRPNDNPYVKISVRAVVSRSELIALPAHFQRVFDRVLNALTTKDFFSPPLYCEVSTSKRTHAFSTYSRVSFAYGQFTFSELDMGSVSGKVRFTLSHTNLSLLQPVTGCDPIPPTHTVSNLAS